MTSKLDFSQIQKQQASKQVVKYRTGLEWLDPDKPGVKAEIVLYVKLVGQDNPEYLLKTIENKSAVIDAAKDMKKRLGKTDGSEIEMLGAMEPGDLKVTEKAYRTKADILAATAVEGWEGITLNGKAVPYDAEGVREMLAVWDKAMLDELEQFCQNRANFTDVPADQAVDISALVGN